MQPKNPLSTPTPDATRTSGFTPPTYMKLRKFRPVVSPGETPT